MVVFLVVYTIINAMHADRMRAIDYWVGVPLSWLITLWYKVMRIVGLKDPEYAVPPKRILFIELAEMGSTILAYPTFRICKEQYPNAEIYFLVFSQNRATADLITHIPPEHVLTIDSASFGKFFVSTIHMIRHARACGIDTVVNLEMFARFSTILSYLIGAKKRVGFHRFYDEGLYTGDFLTHKVAYNPHIHTAESFIALVRALAEDPSDIPMGKFSVRGEDLSLPVLLPTEEEKSHIWRMLTREAPDISEKNELVILNPNASKLIEVRKWPIDRYVDLAKKIIAERSDAYILVIGSASEYEEAAYIISKVASHRALNLAGKTTLRELVHLFGVADVLVTNDSGPAHFASLTPIHIFVFFGPETPKLYKPLSPHCTVLYSWFACSPCVSVHNQRRTSCNKNKCLGAIEVEEVYKNIAATLDIKRV